jgi:hypothetical protein
MSESLMRLLAELPPAELEPERADRIRRRCRARIVRAAPRAASSRVTFAHVWQPLVAVLGVAYLIGAIIEAVRAMYRLS